MPSAPVSHILAQPPPGSGLPAGAWYGTHHRARSEALPAADWDPLNTLLITHSLPPRRGRTTSELQPVLAIVQQADQPGSGPPDRRRTEGRRVEQVVGGGFGQPHTVAHDETGDLRLQKLAGRATRAAMEYG